MTRLIGGCECDKFGRFMLVSISMLQLKAAFRQRAHEGDAQSSQIDTVNEVLVLGGWLATGPLQSIAGSPFVLFHFNRVS